MNEDRAPEHGGYGAEPATPLEFLERIIASLPPGDPTRSELIALRSNVAEQEEMISEARQTIEKLDEVIKKVTSPANRIGTYLGSPNKETAQIVVGGSDYYCNVDPRISIAKLKKGTRVLVNEAYVVVGDLGYDPAGPVTKITEILGQDRLRVGQEHGMQSIVLQRSHRSPAFARPFEGDVEGRRRNPGRSELSYRHRVIEPIEYPRLLPGSRSRDFLGQGGRTIRSAQRNQGCD